MRGSTLLDRWLKRNVPNISAWARELGVEPSYVCHLRRRRRKPSLEVAFRIEDVTRNEVPARSWV